MKIILLEYFFYYLRGREKRNNNNNNRSFISLKIKKYLLMVPQVYSLTSLLQHFNLLFITQKIETKTSFRLLVDEQKLHLESSRTETKRATAIHSSLENHHNRVS